MLLVPVRVNRSSRTWSPSFKPHRLVQRHVLAMGTMLCVMGLASHPLPAQSAPDSPGKIWQGKQEKQLDKELSAHPEPKYDIDASRKYTLAELIDMAQQHNP